MEKLNHFSVLDGLPVAVMVVDVDYSLVYGNASFQELMKLAAFEFGSATTATKTFTAACRSHQHKKEWLMRIEKTPTQGVIALKVIRTTVIREDDSEWIIHTIIAESDIKKKEIRGNTNYLIGVLRVDTSNETVYLGRTLVDTSPIEFRLLSTFCGRPDTLLSRAELLKAVWQKRSLNTRTLDVYVSRLNCKFRAHGGSEQVIVPIHGRGYMMQSSELS